MIKKNIFKNFDGWDRFDLPHGIIRVTAGYGGETFLIDCGSETALYDTGMAFCAKGTIANIEHALASTGKERLDYVLMSHTHYDHIGALPYIIRRWPNVKTVGSAKSARVFRSEGAKATIKNLGEKAATFYYQNGLSDYKPEAITVEGLRTDIVVSDGDELTIGSKRIVVYSTPGHTDCSLSYRLFPDDIFFLSESVGVLEAPDLIDTSILKSFSQSIESAAKCRAAKAKTLMVSHYGVIPKFYNDKYFDLYIRTAEAQRDRILKLYRQGKSYDEIFEDYKAATWNEMRAVSQPYPAFELNARYIIGNVISEFGGEKKEESN
ncbi:MAG: MBL fold metallo-hydrolase [Eubacterium sp.]|jgi:glyoxylase-like metal-dependent hydrolase (beta-lactamase superfamily II)